MRQHWETMFWTVDDALEFVRDYLGPVLHCQDSKRLSLCDDKEFKQYLSGLMIMIHDDQKPSLPDSLKKILEDKKAMEFVNGVGLHWYMAPPLEDITRNARMRGANATYGSMVGRLYKAPADTLDKLHLQLTEARKDGFIFGTEACNGFYPDPDIGEAHGANARFIFGKNTTTHVVKGSFQRGEV